MEFIVIVVTWIASAVLCMIIAESKRRNDARWFFLGLFFGVFALILILALPSLEGRKALAYKTDKICQFCAQQIRAKAVVCPYCTRALDE